MTDYTSLITSEHADKPRFVAAVAAATVPFSSIQTTFAGFNVDFDLDTAVGSQLDVIGEWVGIGRDINTPLTGVYFSLDTVGIGFDEGYWKRRFDPTQGVTSLLDDAYRLLIRATIALNSWDGTAVLAAEALAILFPDNPIYIQDNFDMTMTIAVSGPVLDVISGALLSGGYLALKPCTVRINYVFTSDPPSPVFGLDVDNSFLGGFDTGAWGQDTPAI